MIVHACLARSGPTPTAPGDTFDCPDCRVELLQAFREPARPPETFRPAAQALPESACLEPELCTAADPCPVCGPEPDEPCLVPGRHETRSSIHQSPISEGWGFWYASCCCGWRKSGVYGPPTGDGTAVIARRPVGPESAQAMADKWAEHHRRNPLPEPDGAVLEHRLDHGVGTHPDGASGTWIVSCTCGFLREGFYGPLYDPNASGVCLDRRHAYQACQRWMNHHRQNPEEK